VPVYKAPLSNPSPVRIGKGAFLGVHCMIGPGVQIGEHAVVAANSVVVNDVPAYALAMGNPARVVRFQDAKAGNIGGVAEATRAQHA
jgi:acetyltransferase-like isoleucine patch superfamily enzyme